MLLVPNDYYQLYDELLAEQRTTEERNVLIFAATASCDAVCATKIIMAMLKQDAIPHSVVPVGDYDDLQVQFEAQLGSAQDKRTVFLVGMGANEDMEGMLRLDEEPFDKVKLVILSCQRPLNHAYNRQDDGHRIQVLIDDTDTTLQSIPDPALDPDSTEPQESDPDDDEEERRRKRQRRDGHQEHVSHHYGQGFHHGKPAACLALDFVRALRKDQPLHYWWSILGFTEQYIHHMISEEAYLQLVNDMKAFIQAQGLNDMARHDEEWDGENSVLVNIPLYDQIEDFSECRLPMLVHWTLWDAVVCSPYLAPRLQTYSEKGRETVKLLLLSMGIPLQSAQTTWTAVTGPLQERVQRMLREVGPRYKFAAGWFDSFRWMKGYDEFGLPAVDAVYAINALVETGGRLVFMDSTVEVRRKNFMDLLQALGSDSKAKLRRGLEAAKTLQRMIVVDGGCCMMRREFTAIKRGFLVCDMSNVQLHHKLLTTSPNTLLKMGLFLQDAHAHRAGGRQTALVLVGPTFMEGENEYSLVIGLTQRDVKRRKGNLMGDVFQRVADQLNLAAPIQAFDPRIVKVPASKTRPFWEEVAFQCVETKTVE